MALWSNYCIKQYEMRGFQNDVVILMGPRPKGRKHMGALLKSISRNQKGFTLVEMMIVMAVLAIIAAVGGTALLTSLPNMRLKSTSRDIYSAMMRTKAEAVRRGENVTLLFNSPGNSYVMFLDRQPPPAAPTANDDNEILDPGETVLIATTTFPNLVTYDPAVSVDGVSFNNNAIIFSMRGIPVGAAGTVSLRATDRDGTPIRQRFIAVSVAGRINMQ